MEIPFGTFLKRRRIAVGFATQRKFAQASGLSAKYVSWIELGIAPSSRIKNSAVDRMAETLRVSPDLLRRWSHAGLAPPDAAEKGDLCVEESGSHLTFSEMVVTVLGHRELVEALLTQQKISAPLVRHLVESGSGLSRAEYQALIARFNEQGW